MHFLKRALLASAALIAFPFTLDAQQAPGPTVRGLNAPHIANNRYYTDNGSPQPTIVRLGDRATMGCASGDNLAMGSGATYTWANGATFVDGWMERDAALSVCAPSGGAYMALSRTSDTTPGFAAKSAFGYNALAVADVAPMVAEGAYFEAWATGVGTGTCGQSGAVCPSSAYLFEGDAVNTIGPIYSNPYALNPSGGAYGIMLGAGGGGGSTATIYPSSFAYGCTANISTWNHCIVIGAASLTGDNGTTGTAEAIVMGKGHIIQWDFDSSDVAGGYIRSDATAAGLGLVFTNAGLTIQNNAGSTLATFNLGGGLAVPGTINGTNFTGSSIVVNSGAIYGPLTVTGGFTGGAQTLAFATSLAHDLNSGNLATVTLTANLTQVCPYNLHAGSTFQQKIIQDSTGGRVMTWPSCFKWAGGVQGVLSTAANAVDVLTGTSFDGTTVEVTLAKAFQ